MARKFMTDIDLTLFKLIGALMNPLSSDPAGLSTGDKGRLWFNTTSNLLKYWNGTAAIDPLDRSVHSGTQLAATISNLAATVQAYRLDQFAVPTAPVAMNGQKITGLADGTAGTDAAAYGQVLAMVNNQVFKTPVRAATTANITTLAGGAPNTLDGVPLAATDRILVKDQSTGSQNGIYTVTTLGTGANGTWTRATDADTSAEVTSGIIVPVTEGTVAADRLYMLTTNNPITLATTALVFANYGATAGEILTGGAGLVKTGTVMDVGAGTGITVNADDVAVNFAVVPKKATGNVPATTSGAFAISGAVVTWTHSLANLAADLDVVCGTVPIAGTVQGQPLEVEYVNTDANTITITFPSAPAANNYVVSAMG